MVGVRQFDEQAVLSRALEVFWRKGVGATSMIDLAKATGVQRGSLYNAYGDKEALFLLAYEDYAARFLATARKALDDPDPRPAIASFFDAIITGMSAGSPSRGCLATKTATDPAALDPRIQQRLRLLLEDLEAMISETLSRAAPEALTLSPMAAARLIVTFTRGLAVMERVYREPARLRADAAALMDALWRP